MDITIKDNGDGTFTLQDSDRGTLAAAIVITPNYKSGDNTCVYNQGWLDNAIIYDPTATLAQEQAQESQLQQEITQEQTLVNNPPTNNQT